MGTRFAALALAAALWSCTALAVDTRVIAEQNLFDPQRRPWPEPAAAAPAVSPLAPDDIEVQGVVVVGGVKRAIIKLGGRLRAPGGAGGRSNVVLGEGQAIGGYTLESVQALQLVFSSGGNRFMVPFARSPRREMASAASAPPLPPVIQSATLPVTEPVPGAPVAAPPQFPPPPVLTRLQPQPAPPAAAAPAQAPFPGGQLAPQQAGLAAPAFPAAAPGTPPPASPLGMSLLEAIQAAEAARRAGQLPAAPVNPFQPKSP